MASVTAIPTGMTDINALAMYHLKKRCILTNAKIGDGRTARALTTRDRHQYRELEQAATELTNKLVAAITLLAAKRVRMFGIEPRVALLSHSNFGSRNTRGSEKMQKTLSMLSELAPDLEVDGEMKADTALSGAVRNRILPESRLTGRANLLVMPNLDAANITFNALKVLANGVSVGPILLGPRRSVHIIGSNTTARGIVNLTAVAGVQTHL